MTENQNELVEVKSSENVHLAGSQQVAENNGNEKTSNSAKAAEREEPGCCGCKSSVGLTNGGKETIDASTLQFNPKTDLEKYKKIYIESSYDMFEYYSYCAAYLTFSGFKIYGSNPEDPTKVPTFLFNANPRSKCTCSHCRCCDAPCAMSGFFYMCHDTIVSQLDYKVKGIPFGTMGRMIKKGCHNDCTMKILCCARAHNYNLVRLHKFPNDYDADKGEYTGLTYTPEGCCLTQAGKTNFDFGTEQKFVAIGGAKCCYCMGGMVDMEIQDAKGNVVANCNVRAKCEGTKINEDGQQDLSYQTRTDYDTNMNDCCAIPIHPYFTICFKDSSNLSSMDKWSIINLVLYRLHYQGFLDCSVRACD